MTHLVIHAIVATVLALSAGRPALVPLRVCMVACDRVAPSAEGTTTVPAGDYTLQVISDHGMRVWMDGAMILDDWAPHESKVSRVPIDGGQHRFKVEYYDVTGFAELRFDIQRK